MRPSSSADPTKIQLQQQLQVIDRAIEILATEKDLSPNKNDRRTNNKSNNNANKRGPPTTTSLLTSQSLSHLFGKNEATYNVGEDESFKIQTMTVETITCPDCYQQVDIKTFKLHETQLCTNKIITCPNVGCGTQMHASTLKWHLQEECAVAQQRRSLLQKAELRIRQKENAEKQRKEDEKRKMQELLEAKQRVAAAALAAERRRELYEPESTTNANAENEASATVNATASNVKASGTVVCSQCGEGIRESQLALHMSKTCHFRTIMCPNYGLGCSERKIPYAHLNQHLTNICPAEKLRESLIQKSKLRQELVQCSTCGEMVSLANWRRHERFSCPNRLVPCRNHHVGCPCMLPLRERHLHEHIDEQYERFTLYMPGSGSHLAMDEGDISAPWTAEYWLYKPHATESLKTSLRNILLLLPAYEAATAVEMRTHRHVMRIVLSLRNDNANNPETLSLVKSMDKNEKKLWSKQQAEQKVAWVNELTTMIPVYTDAMLAYLRAFQNLAINIEAALEAARDVKFHSNPAWDMDTLISLQSDYPGKLAEIKQDLGSFAAKVGETAPAHQSNHNSVAHSANNSKPHTANNTHTDNNGNDNNNHEDDNVSFASSLLTAEEQDHFYVNHSRPNTSSHNNNNNAVSAHNSNPTSNHNSRPNTSSHTNNNTNTTATAANADGYTMPKLTAQDYERIVSLSQGESHIAHMFAFAITTIALQDAQLLVTAETSVLEGIQLAQEKEMNMMEESHTLLMQKEEETERIFAEKLARQKQEEQDEKRRAAEEAEAAAAAALLAEQEEGQEGKVQGDQDSPELIIPENAATSNGNSEENEEELSAAEILAAEIGHRLPPPVLDEVGEHQDHGGSEDHDENNLHDDNGENNPEITYTDANNTDTTISTSVEEEAKRLYPDYLETGGGVRLVQLQRVLTAERTLLREQHVLEVGIQLQRCEHVQSNLHVLESQYTAKMDDLIGLLGASFPSLQNTQACLYHYLFNPQLVLYPGTNQQCEQYYQRYHQNNDGNVDHGGFDDGMNDDFFNHYNSNNNNSSPSVFATIRKSIQVTSHTIDDWLGLLQCFARLLKMDFDTLQKLRIAAGLLTPEPKKKKEKKSKGAGDDTDDGNNSVTSSNKHKKSEEELEKAQKKKEKERLRREMRKNKKLMDQEEALQAAQEAATQATAAAVATANATNNKTTTSTTTATTANSSSSSKDAKIITRTSELLRAGCGAEILAEAATVNKDHNRCRLMASMFSGLSILTMEFDDSLAQVQNNTNNTNGNDAKKDEGDNNEDEENEEEEEKEDKNDPHYELLISKNEFLKLAAYNGQVGFIFAPTSSSAAENSANTTATNTSTNKANSSNSKKQSLIESLGTQAITYNAKIMRGRWTHVAYVSQVQSDHSAVTNGKNNMKKNHRQKNNAKNNKNNKNKNKKVKPMSNSARLLLYMDGQYIGGQKDCVMPLPMLSLGGSPWSLQSFTGVLLDVRYWARSRSNQQISYFSHRLVQLSPIVVSHSGSSQDAPVDYHATDATTTANNNGEEAEDAGLIAWWTCDDGPGCSVVTDVTRHRFKTPLHYSVLTAKALLLLNNDAEVVNNNASSNHTNVVVVETTPEMTMVTKDKKDNNTTDKNTNNTKTSTKNKETANTNTNTHVTRTWDLRYETGDPLRYPLPFDFQEAYLTHINQLARTTKQLSMSPPAHSLISSSSSTSILPLSTLPPTISSTSTSAPSSALLLLPVYLGVTDQREVLYQVVTVAAPAAIMTIAIAPTVVASSRPTTSNTTINSNNNSNRIKPVRNMSGRNKQQGNSNGNSQRNTGRDKPRPASFVPQLRTALYLPYHQTGNNSSNKGNSSRLNNNNNNNSNNNSTHNTGRPMSHHAMSSHRSTTPSSSKLPTQNSNNWMSWLWSRMRRHHWLCAETIPTFAKTSSLHGASSQLTPSEVKAQAEKEKKKKLAAMMLARKLPTKEDIRLKELENRKKKTPQLPYYLFEEHKIRAQGAENVHLLPLPSFREQNLCLFELRRHRLAKQGRLLYSSVSCPLQCGVMHIQKRQLRHHLQHICSKRMVHCRFFAYCDALFPAEMQEIHETHSCAYLQRFSHTKMWAERAQWTKEHQRPCPDCNEPVLMLNEAQEQQLQKEIARLEAKKQALKHANEASLKNSASLLRSPSTRRVKKNMVAALSYAAESVASESYDEEEDEDNEDDDDDDDDNDNEDNQSLKRAQEQYQRSWVYHRDYACIYRKVYCPRVGCRYARKKVLEYDTTVSKTSPNSNKNNNGGQNNIQTQGQSSPHEKTANPLEPNQSFVPPPRLPYHLLSHHLDVECTGSEVQQRCVVIERARSRHPYPRPWGIQINIPKNTEEVQAALEAGTYPEEPLVVDDYGYGEQKKVKFNTGMNIEDFINSYTEDDTAAEGATLEEKGEDGGGIAAVEEKSDNDSAAGGNEGDHDDDQDHNSDDEGDEDQQEQDEEDVLLDL